MELLHKPEQKRTEKNENVKIIIDNRENKNRIPVLLGKKCNIEMKQLEIGDFVLSDDCCAERKTVNDFINSVLNRRLFDQMRELKGAYSCPVLIVEGTNSLEDACKDTKVKPGAMHGAMACIILDYQIPVLHTKDQRATADMLYAIARREQQEMHKSTSIRQKQGRSENEKQEFLIAGLPAVDKKTAVRLLEHFNTPSEVFTASPEALQKVPGIGKQKAWKIREILNRAYEKSVL